MEDPRDKILGFTGTLYLDQGNLQVKVIDGIIVSIYPVVLIEDK